MSQQLKQSSVNSGLGNQQRLSGCLTNTRSLLHNVHEFKLFLDSVNPDIFVLTETWLDSSLPSSLFACCQSYHVFRMDRPSRGGGVCVLIKKLPHIRVNQVSVPTPYCDMELVAVDLRDSSGAMPLRLIAAYRPPHFSTSQNDLFFSALDHLAESCARVCVLGDFNLPQFNWDLFLYPDTHLYKMAASFICNHGLTQLVDDPTRGNNILDLILCSDVMSIDDTCILPPLGSSDHVVISYILQMSFDNSSTETSDNTCTRPNFSKADWPGLCNYLSSVNWLSVFQDCAVTQQYWDLFFQIVLYGIDTYVPRFKRTKHTVAPKLYPRHVRKLFSKKRHCWKLYRQFKTHSLHSKYKAISKRCTDAIKDCVVAHENELVSDGRLGKFYRYVNNKLNGSNGIAPLKDSNGVLMYSDADKAVLLNSYFSSIFTVDNGVIDSQRLPPKVGTFMPPVFFTPPLVVKYIKQLKSNGSPGPDGIPAEFYKVCSNLVSFPLSQIFNLSLQSGSLPELWKCASITPVFKKGANSDPSNYRPISLTCIACKLLEAGVKDSLLHHLLQHKLISTHQHGFLSKRSTTTQLLECCLDWNVALNTRRNIDIVYLDYAKAFDSVVHPKLLAKLACYGISDMLLLWIKDFLSNRRQFVKIGNACSQHCCVLSGVPQGSVLGPVLFIVYINDICGLTSSGITIKLFADDAKLYTVIDNAASQPGLQSCLSEVLAWSDHWQLTLSTSKCSVMHVGPSISDISRRNFDYYIGPTVLPSIDCCTDLGVTYNTKLSFRSHIDLIAGKASLRAKLILKCFQSRDHALLSKAFCVFVRPLLEYCCVVWSPHYKLEIDKIESVQRQFTKRLTGLWNVPYCNRLARLNLDSLFCRRVKTDLVMCYKILHNLTCLIPENFVCHSTVDFTRGNSMKLVKGCVASVRDGNFFPNRVINYWNALSDNIVTAPSVNSFHSKICRLHFSDLCTGLC